MTLPITPDDVVEASRALRGIAVRTPHISVPALNEAAGATVIVKAENMQRTGSFKFRGAYHHAASLPADARQRGIIGASSGNHAQALALAGRLLDAPTMVVIPSDAPRAKVEGAVALGADVVLYDRRFGDRDALVADLAEQHGLTIIPSANSPLVMAGAGTAAMELIADHPEITTLVVPVGGGGLAAGTAVIAKDLRPEIRVVGVEPRSAADTLASLRAGRRVSLAEVPSTVADGLGHTTPSELPWQVNSLLLDDVVTVADHDITSAMGYAFQHLKCVAEPSGAVALAAVLAHRLDLAGQTVGVVVSGGGVDLRMFHDLTSSFRTRNGTPAHA
ncbi:threonine ammonia-lyase [Streptomyces sp. NBC_01244]|uniref:threonine ammonia-lyase n=1 Tax=Streptomyces sp. NBC_01244 TaxID=2903797 RepID=UPI002E11FB25|nr:threonine/serine dehydratase [Streptomyces sp. NBC_01244]